MEWIVLSAAGVLLAITFTCLFVQWVLITRILPPLINELEKLTSDLKKFAEVHPDIMEFVGVNTTDSIFGSKRKH